MTASEIKYETNAAICRAIGHFIEVMEDELKVYKLLCNLDKIIEITGIIADAEADLDPIYDEQIRLFDIVYEERRLREIEQKRLAKLEALQEFRHRRLMETRRFELSKRLTHH